MTRNGDETGIFLKKHGDGDASIKRHDAATKTSRVPSSASIQGCYEVYKLKMFCHLWTKAGFCRKFSEPVSELVLIRVSYVAHLIYHRVRAHSGYENFWLKPRPLEPYPASEPTEKLPSPQHWSLLTFKAVQ